MSGAFDHVVVTDIVRPAASDVAALSEYGVATIHEAMGRTGLCAPRLRPVYPGARLCGPAVTVLLPPGDNLMIHAAVEQVQPGDVLVVALMGECHDGVFGELLATSLRAHGATGLVIDAGCRDVDELQAMDFPVFSREIHARGAVKASPGSVNVDVVCGERLVRPGDVVAADTDGVVVVPREHLTETVTASRSREDREALKREQLASGRLGLDLDGHRDLLTRLGVRYVSTVERSS